jgi:inner membrane protein
MTGEEGRSVLTRARDSMMLKLVIVGFLMLILLIPLGMISSLVSERSTRERTVVNEIAGTWGRAQVVGPVALGVPYRVQVTDAAGRVSFCDRFARFLPEDLHIDGRILPDVRRRSIFDVVVYTAQVKITGYFQRPNVASLRINESTVLWDDVKMTMGVTDRKGINPGVALTWRGERRELSPSIQSVGVFQPGLEVSAGSLRETDPKMKLPFEIVVDLKGTETFSVQPAGNTTTVHLTSTWPDPSFMGAFLPDSRQVGEGGFDATWRLTSLSRGYPQAWRDEEMPTELNGPATGSAFGVSLITPVDMYQQTERTLKYGALFILLTFTTFLLVELLQSVRVHPIQYVMVGAALCLFYLLLLSLSEHVRFGLAYSCGAAATIGVITMYTMHVLGGARQGLLTGTGLTGLYAFLYVLLQLEDYALLAGSIALFLILAFVMFVTRRINWYELRRSPA